MNCNEARRMITSYVKKELSDKELEHFLHHVEHCSDCMDELDTYYMVYQALDLLDSGGHHDFDLRKMLRDDIRSAQYRLLRRRAAGIIGGVMLILTELLLAASVYTGYEVEKIQTEHTLIQRAILRFNGHSAELSPAGTGGSALPPDEPRIGMPPHAEPQLEMPHGKQTVPETSLSNGQAIERPENSTEKGADYAG